MKNRLFTSAFLLCSLTAYTALADIPPPDACMTEGEACQNAGPSHDAAGVCVKESCERQTQNGPVSYECFRCVQDDAGDGAGGGMDCQAIPVCPEGSEQVQTCPDDPTIECEELTLCGSTILCTHKEGQDGAGGHREISDGEGGEGGEGGAHELDGAGGDDDAQDDHGGRGGEGGEGGAHAEDSEDPEDDAEEDLGDGASVGQGGGGGASPVAVTSASPDASTADTTPETPSMSCAVQAPQGRSLLGFGGPLAMIAAGVLSLRLSSRRPKG